MLKDQLKIELKKWEYAFIKEHGRDPNKDDIKRLPEIRNMYKKYARLRKDHSPVASHSAQEQRSSAKASVMELGPTPQIYGKAMSIFDMNISPIKTSPIDGTRDSEEPVIIKHTTDDLPACEDLPVKRQLTFTSPAPSSSPRKGSDCRHKAYGPNSPLKWEKENLHISIKCVSPLKRTPVKGFNQGTVSFSPSPLVRRPLTRPLLELMKEHEAIVEEFKQMEDKDDETLLSSKRPDNIFAEEEEIVLDDERKTVKTRRRKILRRKVIEEQNEGIEKNIAEEITKLKQQRVKDFLGVNENSTEDNDDSAAGPDQQQEQGKETITKSMQKGGRKRNKKYNLVSNNFRRLKLPTKKAGNRRWNNRRR
ncbi:hypothetical protein HG536_0A03990 [Torulaspora globosa]|uniref:DNA replication regulator SLD2 n=1 Tax=Torulaspora globosa TaxID=48254 RepID=A0A7G3ZAP5_9SACH|nr:uncharacterized protein HG536_0A03990 [Torulaspora globosa]QLL30581.1 hypothetical protein HG536_0A03990 [Torulaspora globosa]